MVFELVPPDAPRYAQAASDFARDGFLHARGLISAPELALLRAAAERVMAPATAWRMRSEDYLYRQGDGSPPVLHRINDMPGKDPAFLALLAHQRIMPLARALFDGEALAMALAMVVKLPGCGVAVNWHRDPAFCRIQHGINFGIYLDDADAENGMLHVVPGSHRRRAFADLGAAVEAHGFALPGSIPVPTRAGDIIIHSENVLHGSQEVASKRHRRVLYLGTRSIREQLAADRGLDDAWIRAMARIHAHAARVRAAGPLGEREGADLWEPSLPGHRARLGADAYVEPAPARARRRTARRRARLRGRGGGRGRSGHRQRGLSRGRTRLSPRDGRLRSGSWSRRWW